MVQLKPIGPMLLLAMLIAAGPATTQVTPAAPALTEEQQQLQTWWDQLAEPEPFCTKALLDFSSKPDQTVAFFKAHLHPLKLEQKDLEAMIKDLGSDDEKVWKAAVEKMQYYDPRLTMDIEGLLDLADGQVARNRLIEVLCDLKADTLKGTNMMLQRINPQYARFVQNTNGTYRSYMVEPKVANLDTPTSQARKKQWARADRAIILLQHIGTPAANELLKAMATGHPDAQPTKIAKLAADSLGG